MFKFFLQRQAPQSFASDNTQLRNRQNISSKPINPKGIKVADVARHNTRDDCWMIVDDKVYDVSSWIDRHPGGDIILSYAGLDATDTFDSFHAESSRKYLAPYEIGRVEDLKISQKLQEHREMREMLKKKGLFHSSKLFYAYKTVFNLMLVSLSFFIMFYFQPTLVPSTLHIPPLFNAASLDFHDSDNNTTTQHGFLKPYSVEYHWDFFRMLAATVFVAFFWQQCGWLSHDFLHHQVFNNRMCNDIMGYFLGNVCQGFSVKWWKAKHNLHHATPNVQGYDPDIDTLPFLAWSEKLVDGELQGLPQLMIKYQHFVYLPLLTAARISWLIQSLLYALRKPKTRTQQFVEVGTLLLHYLWVGMLAFMFVDSIFQGIFFIYLAQAITGLLLATAFSLNHNGMSIVGSKDRGMDFNELQIITARDVKPGPASAVHWFMGGLDMQIEHHLFPTIPRHNLWKVRGQVQEMCKRHAIPYHETTFSSGTKEIFQRLYSVACKI